MTSLTIPGSATALVSYSDMPTATLTHDQQTCLNLAWLKVEDGFDSMPGGPYLLEVQKQNFGTQKMALLFPYALARINFTIPNPPSPAFDLNTFDWNNHVLFAQAMVLEIVAHLRRSYVEMPVPEGEGNITWLSRYEYEQRWKEIYDQEAEQFLNILRPFKRAQLGLGRTRGILHWKAGRLMPLPMRTRVPRSFGW